MRSASCLRTALLVVGLGVVGLGLVRPALAGVVVQGPEIDTRTHGDWRNVYGSCFFLIPNPEQVDFEDPTGPDWFSDHHEQYLYENCYGGPLFSNDPSQSEIDWRIFINNPRDNRAFAYALGGAFPAVPGSGQWNPCRNAFRATTWDNESFANDPMTVELISGIQGSATLAYYFVDSANVCRTIDFELFVDGANVSGGTLSDFKNGKYVVFNLTGLVPGQHIRLDAVMAVTQECPRPPEGDYLGVNSVISGVFIGAPDCTATPSDEDEDESADETPDESSDEAADEGSDGSNDEGGEGRRHIDHAFAGKPAALHGGQAPVGTTTTSIRRK